MSVLSDTTIREGIKQGQLVVGGQLDAAKHCTYEFHAGRLFRGGASAQDSTDWPEGNEQHFASIEPGELAWIRTREKVRMPPDTVGLWCQTSSLSRAGLLLLNASLVEPGYEGYLTAVFVNFGKQRVTIDGETSVAKLLFLSLDKAAGVPFEQRFREYDKLIVGIAGNSPNTFLQVADFVPQVHGAVAQAREAIEKEAEARIAEVEKAASATKDTLSTELAKDVRAQLWRTLGGFGAGCVLAFGVTYFAMSDVYSKLETRYSDLTGKAEKAVSEAHRAQSVRADPRVDRLEQHLNMLMSQQKDEEDLARRVKDLEDRLASDETRE